MAKCKLTLRIDGHPGSYQPGDTIRGTVTLHAVEDVTAKSVTLERLWRVGGWGNTEERAVGKDELASDVQVRAGEQQDLAFAVAAPDGPTTYAGTLVQLDQFIRARADVPWTVDPKIEERYELRPGGTALIGDRAPYTRVVHAARAWNRLRLVALAVAAVLLWATDFPGSLLWLAIAGVVIALFGRNAIAARKLGDIALSIGATRACPGDQIPIHLEIRPPTSVTIDRVAATVAGKESATRGSGSDRQTRTHELLSEETVLIDGGTMERGQVFSADTVVTVPRTTALSWKGSSNSIAWTVAIRIVVPSWPDWGVTRELVLVPGQPSTIEPVATAALSAG